MNIPRIVYLDVSLLWSHMLLLWPSDGIPSWTYADHKHWLQWYRKHHWVCVSIPWQMFPDTPPDQVFKPTLRPLKILPAVYHHPSQFCCLQGRYCVLCPVPNSWWSFEFGRLSSQMIHCWWRHTLLCILVSSYSKPVISIWIALVQQCPKAKVSQAFNQLGEILLWNRHLWCTSIVLWMCLHKIATRLKSCHYCSHQWALSWRGGLTGDCWGMWCLVCSDWSWLLICRLHFPFRTCCCSSW